MVATGGKKSYKLSQETEWLIQVSEKKLKIYKFANFITVMINYCDVSSLSYVFVTRMDQEGLPSIEAQC